jgi:hypothetical protein
MWCWHVTSGSGVRIAKKRGSGYACALRWYWAHSSFADIIFVWLFPTVPSSGLTSTYVYRSGKIVSLMLGVFCSNISVSVKDVRCYGIFKLETKELYHMFVYQCEVGGSHDDCYTDCIVLESDAVYSDRNLPTFIGSGCLDIRVRRGACVQKRNVGVEFFFLPRGWK